MRDIKLGKGYDDSTKNGLLRVTLDVATADDSKFLLTRQTTADHTST